MKEKNSSGKAVRKMAVLAVLTALAMLLSWVEAILPPVFTAVPGIKVGLPNIVILIILYRFGFLEAGSVSLVRILLVSLLFGNPLTLAYSLAGGALSLFAMALLKKTAAFSTVGVSVVGGILHNLGQIAVAMIVLHTAEIGYYMIVLAVTGTLAGILVGAAGAILLKKLPMLKI